MCINVTLPKLDLFAGVEGKFRMALEENTLWGFALEGGVSPANGVRVVLGIEDSSPWIYDVVTKRMQYGFSGYCLHVSQVASGKHLQLYSCQADDANQQWKFASSGCVYLSNTNYCIDNSGGHHTEGNALTTYSCDSDNQNQIWKIVREKFRISLSQDPIWSLTLQGGATPANGVKVVLGSRTNSPWSYNGLTRMVEYESSGYCLYVDINNESERDLELYSCQNVDENLQWNIANVGNIRLAVNTKYCIDNSRRRMYEGNSVIGYRCKESAKNQFWEI
eukprot:Awhi_evm1s11019